MIRNILYTSMIASFFGLQACSNSGGSGAEVTGDEVISYTVGGTVAGLTGSGLVLQNNNGDDLAIGADGVFTFATQVTNDQPYSVSVLSQPGPSNLGCSVSNGEGSSNTTVSDININCLSVGLAQKVETIDLGITKGPVSVKDTSGNITTVWLQADGTGFSVWSNLNVTGTGWGVAELIETTSGEATDVAVVIDAAGNITATWAQNSGTFFYVWSNRYVAGAGWGSAELITAEFLGDASAPSLTIDDTGNVIAVWRQNNGSIYNIWSNRYDINSGWGTAVKIENEDLGNAGDIYTAYSSDDGNTIAVWLQDDGNYFNIWSNIYTPGTGWGPPAKVENANGDVTLASYVIDSAGNITVVWAQPDGLTINNEWATRYVSNTGWLVAEKIETEDLGGSTTSAELVVDSSGNVTTSWRQSDATNTNIWVNRYTMGSGWGTAEKIEAATGTVSSAVLSTDSMGNVAAAWKQFDSTSGVFNLYANRFVAGNGWGSAQLLENEDIGDVKDYVITTDADDNVTLVWNQGIAVGNMENLWANRFTPASGWGIAEKIETEDLGGAFGEQLMVDQNGNNIAIWYQSDGVNTNLWANRYVVGSGWSVAQKLDSEDLGSVLTNLDNLNLLPDQTGGGITAIWTQSNNVVFNLWANRIE